MVSRKLEVLPVSTPFLWRGKKGWFTHWGSDGPIRIDLDKHLDKRGAFCEFFNSEELSEITGIPELVVQTNLSETFKGVIRGMHIQHVKPQGKLVYCVSGKILDACVDLRPWSPTYKQHLTQNLEYNATTMSMFYVPPGWAHGFCTLKDSVVGYLCTTGYAPKADGGVHPLKCGIGWPWNTTWILSEKDNQLPSLVDYRPPQV